MSYDIYIGEADVLPSYQTEDDNTFDRWQKWLTSLPTEERSLLACMLLADDAPSGAVADWISERGMPGQVYAASLRVQVGYIRHKDAPVFTGDEMTGDSNSRHPGYGSWHDFCQEVGLDDLFFNRDAGLMREHPGTFRLEPQHAETISAALKRYHGKHPNMTPRFGNSDEEACLGRLIWLDWWARWAVTNCKVPAIHNH